MQRWLWPLGLLLLLALLHACCARAHRLRPALAWALLALACAAHGADATPHSTACALLRIDGYSFGSRPLARLCGAAGLALLGLSLYAQAWHGIYLIICMTYTYLADRPPVLADTHAWTLVITRAASRWLYA